MSFYVALRVAKILSIILKITSKFTSLKGSEFPGKIAILLCPDFIKYINKAENVIAVTGTNGKTTITNMIADILNKNKYKVSSNSYGSNLNYGVATALINGVSFFNKTIVDYEVLEIDERSCVRIYPYLKPKYIICSNLSRDSIMRNAHPFYIFDLLNKYIPDDVTMILNADDLISSQLKPNNKHIYYGIGKQDGDKKEDVGIINDARICPKCYSKMDFKYIKYGQFGKAICPNCGYSSKDADYLTQDIDYQNKEIVVKHNDESYKYHMISDSIFNIYNETAVITLLKELGLSDEKIADAIAKISIVESRFKEDYISDIKVVSAMAKGMIAPACSAVLDYVRKQEGNKEVVLYLEDQHEAAKGSENIAWIYDCDFEYLNQEEVKNIVVVGIRRYDYLLRLLMANIPKEKIKLVEKSEDVVKQLELKNNTTVYILYDLYSKNDRDKIINQIKEAKGQ